VIIGRMADRSGCQCTPPLILTHSERPHEVRHQQ